MKLFDLFSKNPRSLFLEFVPQDSTWQVVSWNFDLKDLSSRLWTVEIHKNGIQRIDWEKKDQHELKFFKGEKLLCHKKNAEKNRENIEMMNLAFHSTLKYSLESHHEFLLSPVIGATTADYQSEAKALLWIQASFGTLQRALDQFAKRSDLILSAAVFSGIEPGSGLRVLRILAFNLDIFCYFQNDLSLQIAVFDDKNLGHGGAKTPSFQQIIKVTKPQIYDEIVKLVHRIATVGEVH